MHLRAQALFDVSNPLLHTAKMMNTLKFPQVRECRANCRKYYSSIGRAKITLKRRQTLSID